MVLTESEDTPGRTEEVIPLGETADVCVDGLEAEPGAGFADGPEDELVLATGDALDTFGADGLDGLFVLAGVGVAVPVAAGVGVGT